MSIFFKLSEVYLGIKRRISFDYIPPWSDFAAKVGPLFDIPIAVLGVSYTDEDGDQIFVSSDDELQEYYRLSWDPKASGDRLEPIKFTVYNMRSIHLVLDKNLQDLSTEYFSEVTGEEILSSPDSRLTRSAAIKRTSQSSRMSCAVSSTSSPSNAAPFSNDPGFRSSISFSGPSNQGSPSSPTYAYRRALQTTSSINLSHHNTADGLTEHRGVPKSPTPSLRAVSAPLKASSRLRDDTSQPSPFDFASWFGTLLDQELDTVLKEIDEQPRGKGKARAFEPVQNARTHELLSTPRPRIALAPLKASSHLMVDTSPPGPFDFASWFDTLHDQELDTVLKEIDDQPQEKGKAQAFETIRDARTNEPPLCTLSSLTAKPYIFGESLQRRARTMTFPCRICFEDQLEIFAVYIDPCGHPFCSDCLGGYVRSKLEERRYPIPCPVCAAEDHIPREPGVISRASLQKLRLSESEDNIYTELELAEFAVPVQCQRCDERMLVDRDQYEEEIVITCPLPFCGYSWCRNCNKPVEDTQKRHFCQNDGSTELQVLMDTHGWKLCPGCHTPTSKSTGCNHMTCITPGCNAHFCYRCGELITQSVIGHEISSAKAAHYATCDMYAEVPHRVPTPVERHVPPVVVNPQPRVVRAPRRVNPVHRLLASMFHHDTSL